jgi:hypothetical protein
MAMLFLLTMAAGTPAIIFRLRLPRAEGFGARSPGSVTRDEGSQGRLRAKFLGALFSLQARIVAGDASGIQQSVRLRRLFKIFEWSPKILQE